MEPVLGVVMRDWFAFSEVEIMFVRILDAGMADSGLLPCLIRARKEKYGRGWPREMLRALTSPQLPSTFELRVGTRLVIIGHQMLRTAAIAETATMTTTKSTGSPIYDRSKVTVIFVLGGPGAGKGTQCAYLVKDFGFCHLSAGDLLREEQEREGSEFGELIRTHIKEGIIVPMEGNSGEGWKDGCGRFLIDGFPRKMDQALAFDETVCESESVLFFETTEKVMLERLLERGKTSGRADDNAESIKKRFHTYHETTMPVIEHYKQLGRLITVSFIFSSTSVSFQL
ncbi:Uridylate kinase [Mycena kentingensis (nom. inval.)]|nr:Uridylate kinase [Mycena kentingensis (nom. inval.)]